MKAAMSHANEIAEISAAGGSLTVRVQKVPETDLLTNLVAKTRLKIHIVTASADSARITLTAILTQEL